MIKIIYPTEALLDQVDRDLRKPSWHHFIDNQPPYKQVREVDKLLREHDKDLNIITYSSDVIGAFKYIAAKQEKSHLIEFYFYKDDKLERIPLNEDGTHDIEPIFKELNRAIEKVNELGI